MPSRPLSRLAHAAGKLSKLTQLAQSRSLFEDPTAEINELTHIIKQEITALNGALASLQTIAKAASGASKQRASHSGSVADSLKTRLLDATRDFQDVLHTRSHNMQLMQKRRDEFSSAAAGSAAGAAAAGAAGGGGSGSGTNGHPAGGGGPSSSGFADTGGKAPLGVPYKRFAPPAPIFELCAPPTEASSESGGGGSGGGGGGSGGSFGGGGSSKMYKKTDDYAGGGGGGARSGFAAAAAAWASPAAKPAGMSSGEGGAVVIDMSELGSSLQQQELLPMSGSYLDARAQAVDAVQSTIAELGGIFQQLAEMVHEQGTQLQVSL